MRYIKLLVLALAVGSLFSSCKGTATNTKDIKYMPIRFAPLTRDDVSLIGNLQAEITITGKLSKQGKVLDKQYALDYKKGLISKTEASEILYFAPAPGMTMTGALYDNEIFNTITTPTNQAMSKKFGFLAGMVTKLKGTKQVTAADPAIDFAYFALVEKYPNVDYFINVRFDRRTEIKGKSYTETVIAKADGLTLKVDGQGPDGSRKK